MDTPPKLCDWPVCYGRSHLFGPIRGETDHSDMGWPIQSQHYDPPKTAHIWAALARKSAFEGEDGRFRS